MKYIDFLGNLLRMGRSREGAWIEMCGTRNVPVQARGRSREGAWIEMLSSNSVSYTTPVAPVRERGLKYDIAVKKRHEGESLP